jgi:hypothetical protein
VPQKYLFVFKSKRDSHMHQDLLSAHQIKEAPGGAVPTAERGHEDIGVKSGVCVGNDDRKQIFWFSCEPNTVSEGEGFRALSPDLRRN